MLFTKTFHIFYRMLQYYKSLWYKLIKNRAKENSRFKETCLVKDTSRTSYLSLMRKLQKVL